MKIGLCFWKNIYVTHFKIQKENKYWYITNQNEFNQAKPTIGETPGIGEGVPLRSWSWGMDGWGVTSIGCWVVTCKGWVNKAGGLSRDTDLQQMKIKGISVGRCFIQSLVR